MPVKYIVRVSCDECGVSYEFSTKRVIQTRQLRSFADIKASWKETTGGRIESTLNHQRVLCGKCRAKDRLTARFTTKQR